MSVPEVHPLPEAAASRVRAWSFLVGGDLAYSLLASGFWLVLARAVSAPGLGDVALATALSLPALVVLDGGLAQYMVREIRPGDGGGMPRALRPFVRRRAVGLVLIPPVVAAAMLGLGDTDHRALIGLLIGLSVSFEGAAHGWLAEPRARGNMGPDARFRTVYGATTLLLVLVLWAAGGLTALLAAGASAAGAGLAAAATLGYRSASRRWVDRDVRDPEARRRFTAVMLLGSAFHSADVLVVGAMLGSAALAPYALASKVVAAGRILPSATMRVSLSWAARDAQPSAADEARAGARMGLAIACLGAVAGPWGAALLFGDSYGRAMLEPLVILSAALVFVGLKAPLAGRHLGAGDTRFLVRVSLLTVCAGAAALPIGVAALDATGAALAVLFAEAAGIVLYVRRRAADGWALASLWPRPASFALVVCAVVAGLLLPRFSPIELLPAAVAALAALDLPLTRLIRARRVGGAGGR